MIGITCYHNVASLARRALRQMLHTSNKRTSGIDHPGRASFEIALHLRGDAMSTDDGNRIGACFLRRVDGGDAKLAEALHLLCVMNQRSQRTNRALAVFDSLFNHFDRTFDAKAETEFLCE
jgi:hypothetical protein